MEELLIQYNHEVKVVLWFAFCIALPTLLTWVSRKEDDDERS